METIDDILREMRNLAQIDKESGDMIPRKHMSLALSGYAKRIETAHEFWSAVDNAKAAGEGYAAGKQSATCKEKQN